MTWEVEAAPDITGSSDNFALSVFSNSVSMSVEVPSVVGAGARRYEAVLLLVSGLGTDFGTETFGESGNPGTMISNDIGLSFEQVNGENYTDNLGGPFVFEGTNVAVEGTSAVALVAHMPGGAALSGSIDIELIYSGTPTTMPFLGCALFAVADILPASRDDYQVTSKVTIENREDLGPYPVGGRQPQPWQYSFYAPRGRGVFPDGPYGAGGSELFYTWGMGVTPIPTLVDSVGTSHATATFPGITRTPKLRHRQRDDEQRAGGIASNAPTSRQASGRRGPSNTYI